MIVKNALIKYNHYGASNAKELITSDSLHVTFPYYPKLLMWEYSLLGRMSCAYSTMQEKKVVLQVSTENQMVFRYIHKI